MSRTSARGIIDSPNKVAQLDYYQFLGRDSSFTAKGFFVNELGKRTGNSFTATVPLGNGSANPVSFADLFGAAIPTDAVGFYGQFGGAAYIDINSTLGASNTDFKANYPNYPQVAAGAKIRIGRISGGQGENQPFDISNSLAGNSIAINDGTTTTQKAAVSATGNISVEGQVASAATNAGKPLKVGGAYNSTQPTVTNGQAVDAQYSARGAAIVATGADTFSAAVAGDVAVAATYSGNPVRVGAKGVNAEQTAVTNGQVVGLVTDLVGKLIVAPYSNPENFINGALASDLATTSSTALIAAQSAGVRSYITQFSVSNLHATVSTRVDLLDGSTLIWTGFCAAAGGGFSVTFPVPLRGSAATALNVQCGTTGAQVRAAASGYKGS